MAYSIRFYQDIVRYHETQPCMLHPRTYKTAEEAERVARAELPTVRAKHGTTVGYAIFDATHFCVQIGPGVHDDA